MLNGKIVEQGPKEQIFSPPYHEYTASIIVGTRNGSRLDESGDR